jgi:5-methylthioadenosine/S-adenosylhomocysteine deaminase
LKVYSADWVLPVDSAPIENGAVVVEGERIAAVGPAPQFAGEREHFPGAVIAPGFVNAHSHLEYAAYSGFGDGLPFGPWMGLHVERKRRLDWESTLALARLGAAECLAGGTTTVADASFTGASAIAAYEVGLRAVIHLEVFGSGSGELGSRFVESRTRIEHVLSERVSLGVSPHAPYTASIELYETCLDLGLPVVTHLSESEAEREWLLHGTGEWAVAAAHLLPPAGETGVRLLAREGLLHSPLVGVHCVVVDTDDIRLLAQGDVGVVHCPRSNAMLGCGTAPVAALLEAGVRVGLGTDSPASALTFNMFDEMRAAIWLGRARERRADSMSAETIHRLATLGSAVTIGREQEIGSLSPDKAADIVIVDLSGSGFDPIDDPTVAFVLGGAPERVCRTIVGGMTTYARGETEWRELRRSAAAARERMLGRTRL